MRIFLDTNVLASALATRGLCADLFREVLRAHILVVSPEVLAELERVLAAKFGAPPDLVAAILGLLQQEAVLALPGAPLELGLQDEADLRILAAALAGQAEVFVTGDREVLALARIGSLPILSPRQCWQHIEGLSEG